MAKVILICGKICSGKSYYANMIKEKEKAIILATDEVTYDLTNNEQGEQYEEFANRVNKYLRKKAVELVQIDCNVILDWGFWTNDIRKEITEYFETRNVEIEWHYIDIDDEDWHKNIKERNEKVLAGEGGSAFYVDDGLYQKIVKMFEIPDFEKMDVIYKVKRND